MARPAPPADAPVFEQGTLVLAYHGRLLFEARVSAVHRNPHLSYTLQYQGWAKSWDAQVEPHLVLQHNDHNLAYAHSLLRSAKIRQQAIAPVADGRQYQPNEPMQVRTQIQSPPLPYEKIHIVRHSVPHIHPDSGEAVADTNVTDINGNQSLHNNGTTDGHLPGVLNRPRTVEHENVLRRSRPTPTASEPQSSPSGEDDVDGGTGQADAGLSPSDDDDGSSLFHLPSSLKVQLVDDWEFITKEQCLVPLPRDYTVEYIVDRWVSERERVSQEDSALREVAEAIKIYFDAALPTMLLYRFERLQYNTVFYNGGEGKKASDDEDEGPKRPIQFYGAEHLVRLLLKMPFMLESANIESEMLQKIAEKTNDLGRFIVDHGRMIFLHAYDKAAASYIESVRNGVTQPPPESAVTPPDPAQNGSAGNTNGEPARSAEYAGTPVDAAAMIPENMSPVASNTTPTGRSTPGSSDRGANRIY